MSHIARSALIIAIFIGLEKVLGFVRQVIIARQFGLTAELDAFNAANNLPDAIFGLISGGALAIAFIPVLTEYLEQKGAQPMWEMFSLMTNLLFIVTAAAAVITALFAPLLVSARIGIAPGFGPEQQRLVVDLMRLNLLATLLFKETLMLKNLHVSLLMAFFKATLMHCLVLLLLTSLKWKLISWLRSQE